MSTERIIWQGMSDLIPAATEVRVLHEPRAGIYSPEPLEVRACGCWGLSTPVCGVCTDRTSTKRTSLQWPCPTALAVGAIPPAAPCTDCAPAVTLDT